MTKPIEIVYVNTHAEAGDLSVRGYEPVECSFGEGSILGPLVMDHHGKQSYREGVAVRAYRDHFGARRDDPRFVVTGDADQDATFAIAALAGVLPHPSRAPEFEKAPPHIKGAWTQDLTPLANLVNLLDTAPIGVRLDELYFGSTLLLWDQVCSPIRDATAFHAGVDRWRALLARPPKALLEATKAEEVLRVKAARSASVERVSDLVAVVESPVFGFDVWYDEIAPIIVAYVADDGNITVGARDTATAERLLGKGGLKNVFSRLVPAGWGGREAVGGSPRGMQMTREQAKAAAEVIAKTVVA